VVKTYNITEIDSVAEELWQEGQQYMTWAFYAAMGAGKTTVIHAICEFLQVKETISSPTFALVNEYSSPVAGAIFHMDWYRLKDEQEAIDAGMEDALQGNHYCFIEWPGKAEAILPDNLFRIIIETIDQNTRKISTNTQAFIKKD
jgi:tRNA threonylcarbamoyladenosine biosynthesis protein TsaE